MKNIKIYFFLIVAFSTQLLYGQQCPSTCTGAASATFNNVVARINCTVGSPCTWGYNYETGINTGYKWQCVEYINRYYKVVYGMDLKSTGIYGNAKNYWNWCCHSTIGLTKYANSGATPPAIGDILVSTAGTYGHVAIVTSVSSTQVGVIDQNFSSTSARTLTRNGNTVGSFGNGYIVTGWVRKGTAPAEIPTLITPAQNTSNLSGNINFSWTCPNATNYKLQIIESSNFSGFTTANGFSGTMAYNNNIGNITSFVWTNALPGKTYYWTVQAINAGSTSSFAQYRTFTTLASTCSSPVNISSSNITSSSARINWQLNSTNTNSITLDWSPNGTIWNTLSLPANYYYYDLNTLVPNSTYYYKLRRNCTNGGSSSYSSTYTFTTSPGIVNNGIYKLTRKGSNKVLDAASCGGAGANVQLWDDLNNDCQKWVFQGQSDGSYEIKARYSTGLNLDVLNCLGAGANVRMWNDLNNNCQRWILEAQSDGSFEIKNKNNLTLNLDAQSCGSWAGTNVQVWTDNNENCQRWMLTYLGNASNSSMFSMQENGTVFEDESKVSFEIIPNPASAHISLKFMDINDTGEITIQIHDLAGRLIETLYSGHADNLDSNAHYETSHLHGGTYLVVFSHDQGREVKRLVVVR